MVKRTKKLSSNKLSNKLSKKRSSSKLSKEDQKNVDNNNFYTLLSKKEKVWKKKGEGYHLFKLYESMLRNSIPNAKKELVSLKRCSQEHCKNEFDIIMNKVLVERKKDSKKLQEEISLSYKKVEKANGMKKGEYAFELKDKKLAKKIYKEQRQATENLIKKYEELGKNKYEKYFKALEECQIKHCNHERNTLKQILKADKPNITAKNLYKRL